MRVIVNVDELRVLDVMESNDPARVSLPANVEERAVETLADFQADFGEWIDADRFVDRFPTFTLEQLVAQINELVEAKRQTFVTVGSGQALTYVLKQQQLAAFREAGNAGAQAVAPILYAEASARGTTPQALANVWEAKATQWVSAAVRIEAVKAVAIDNAETAVSQADADAVISELAQSLAAIS